MTSIAGHDDQRHDGFADRLLHLDRRIIFLCVALAVIIPIIRPIGMPIKSSKEAEDFIAALEEVKPGEVVMFSFDYEADVRAELDPMAITTFRYCFDHDIKIVALTNYAGGPGIAEAVYRPAMEEFGKTYGEDFVFLGYNTDWQGTMLRMGESIRATFPADHYGARTDGMSILDGVDSYADIPLLVSVAGSALAEYWAIFAGGKYQQKVITGNTAIQAILVYPYYNAGQISGFLGGLKGAAEFEKLAGYSGDATLGMDAQSTAHGLMVVFILLGNVAFFLQRRQRGRDAHAGGSAT